MRAPLSPEKTKIPPPSRIYRGYICHSSRWQDLPSPRSYLARGHTIFNNPHCLDLSLLLVAALFYNPLYSPLLPTNQHPQHISFDDVASLYSKSISTTLVTKVESSCMTLFVPLLCCFVTLNLVLWRCAIKYLRYILVYYTVHVLYYPVDC